MPLLTTDLLRHLDRLVVLARRVERGTLGGERLTSALGRSLDFAQHREYLPGDDLRLIDWNVYARQERYVVKQFEAEQDLQLYLLVDQSTSMNFGAPTKAERARQLAAALGYVALAGTDRVHAYGLAAGLVDARSGLRGRGQFAALCEFLERLPVGGGTDLFTAVQNFASTEPMPGAVVLCTDCWDLGHFQNAIRLLRFHRHEVTVVQLLTPEELDPRLVGDLQLVDSETGEARDVTATPHLLEQYHETLTRTTEALRRFTVRHGGRFFRVDTATPIDEVVQDVLLAGGLLGRI